MKKVYSKPSMKAYQIKPATILAGSGESNVKASSVPYEDSNNTYVGGMSGGIWGTTNNPD